jgi:hypothetical protein
VWSPLIVALILAVATFISNLKLERAKDAFARGAEQRKLDAEQGQRLASALSAYSEGVALGLYLSSEVLFDFEQNGWSSKRLAAYEAAMSALDHKSVGAEVALAQLDYAKLSALSPLREEVTIVRSHLAVAGARFRSDAREARAHYQGIFERVFWSRAALPRRVANVAVGKGSDVGFFGDELKKRDYAELRKALSINSSSQRDGKASKNELPWSTGTTPASSSSKH